MILIKNKLKKLRTDNAFTQETVAGFLNISTPAYSKIETGKTDISYSRIKQLADVYKISVVQLLTMPPDVVSKQLPELLLLKLSQRQNEINSLRVRLIELYQILKLV